MHPRTSKKHVYDAFLPQPSFPVTLPGNHSDCPSGVLACASMRSPIENSFASRLLARSLEAAAAGVATGGLGLAAAACGTRVGSKAVDEVGAAAEALADS